MKRFLSLLLAAALAAALLIAPAAASDSSGEFDVYLYAAYRDGQELWYIDKRNMTFRVNGKDYMADVRKALGYS